MTRTAVAVVPDIDRFVRESTDLGPMGALINRIRQLGFKALIKLVKHQLPYVVKLAQKDFAAGMLLLTDIELVKTHPLGSILLSAKLTDLALALDNKQLLIRFVHHVRTKYQAPVGFETNNFGFLAEKLGEWRIYPDAIKVNSKTLSAKDKKQLVYLPNSVKIYA